MWLNEIELEDTKTIGEYQLHGKKKALRIRARFENSEKNEPKLRRIAEEKRLAADKENSLVSMQRGEQGRERAIPKPDHPEVSKRVEEEDNKYEFS